MSFINNTAAPSITPQSEEGITLHLKFRPQQKVWTFTDEGISCRTVIRVTTEHRSILDGRTDRIDCRVTYLLDNSITRSEDLLFATKEELIQSIAS